MVMIIIHIAQITCIVTDDAWHANGVIVVYLDISRSWPGLMFRGTGNAVVGWYAYGRGRGP